MNRSKSFLLLLTISILLFTACSTKEQKDVNNDRITKVESMLEIQSVIAAYAMAWDKEDTKEFANHFHKDAIIIDSWHKKELERFKGVQEFMDARKDEGGNVGGHTLSLVHFKELSDSTASTEVVFNYFWYGHFATNLAKTNIRGSYIDEWVKTERGWRIMKRIIEHENVPEHRAESYGLLE